MTPRLAILGALFWLFSLSPVFAQQEFFPFLAQVTTDKVNVRAGQSANFESICQLSRGETVVVVGRSYTWYEIQLPLNARAFISDKYVISLGGVEGEISAEGVNVRAGTGIQSTILGQLDQGSRVRLLGKEEEWYRIEPPASMHGWVADSFLAFKSRDVRMEEREPAPLPVLIPGEQKVMEGSLRPMGADTSAPPLSPAFRSDGGSGIPTLRREGSGEPETAKVALRGAVSSDKSHVSVTGYLRPCLDPGQPAAAHYDLVIDNQPVYAVRGARHILDEFAYTTVAIEGTVPGDEPGRSLRPVLVVSKIQLML